MLCNRRWGRKRERFQSRWICTFSGRASSSRHLQFLIAHSSWATCESICVILWCQRVTRDKEEGPLSGSWWALMQEINTYAPPIIPPPCTVFRTQNRKLEKLVKRELGLPKRDKIERIPRLQKFKAVDPVRQISFKIQLKSHSLH